MDQSGYYWKSFTPVSALMGWLKHHGRCVYCEKLLASKECITEAVGCVDHLLPKKYAELDFKNKKLDTPPHILHFNCVPACSMCNGAKHQYDPNNDGEPIYFGPDSYADEDHANGIQRKLINRSRRWLDQKLRDRRALVDRDIREWAEAMSQLYPDTHSPESLDWELSLGAEAEMLGLDTADEAPKNWLNQLAAAGLRPDLDRVLDELVNADGRERILACIDEFGLEGHRVMEAVATLVLEGKTKDGNGLYRQLKNLAIRLQIG